MKTALLQPSIVLLIASAPAAASAETVPVLLKASTPWEMRYDDDSCFLARGFGEGEQRVVIRLTRFKPGPQFELILTGAVVKTSSPFVSIPVRFGSSEPAAKSSPIDGVSGSLGDMPMLVMSSMRLDNQVVDSSRTDPDLDPGREAAISELYFRTPAGKSYSLHLGPMGAPMAAMRACTTDLVRKWGFDPDQQAHLTRMPMPRSDKALAQVLNTNYPTRLVGTGKMANIRVRVKVDAQGKVAECHIQSATMAATLAELTCREYAKVGRFEPARDASGNAVESYHVSLVAFRVY